ncbi:MAG: hypothetical protein ACI4XM_04410 [Candidatus Coprovivens sp.]
MEIKRNKNFINTYENEIKPYREKYYKDILKYSKDEKKYPIISIYLIPIITSIVTLLITNFNITGYIISFIEIFIINYLIKIVLKYLKIEQNNEYLEILKKKGYYSIEDYEKKLKSIITGPNGYYQKLLNELIEKYKINETTRKVTTTSGEEYYYWTNTNRDKIMLLNTKYNKKPEIKAIHISNIRYYRIDNEKKSIIINTSTEIYSFKIESSKIFNEIIKEKKLENITAFNPATYIDDFEIYMHSIKSEDNKKNLENSQRITKSVNYIIIFSIIYLIISLLIFILKKYLLLLNILNVISICIISINLQIALSTNRKYNKTDTEYIKELNTNPECITRFEELKYVLGIKPTYDNVYTPEGVEYKTWLANGYFHVFLNLIYFNTVYMSVKISDVAYYKKEDNECIVKLKDKTLVFTSDSEEVFRKILPNKDYYWLKGYQKK